MRNHASPRRDRSRPAPSSASSRLPRTIPSHADRGRLLRGLLHAAAQRPPRHRVPRPGFRHRRSRGQCTAGPLRRRSHLQLGARRDGILFAGGGLSIHSLRLKDNGHAFGDSSTSSACPAWAASSTFFRRRTSLKLEGRVQFVDDAFGIGAGGVSGTAGVKWYFYSTRTTGCGTASRPRKIFHASAASWRIGGRLVFHRHPEVHDGSSHIDLARTPGLVRVDDHRHEGGRIVLQDRRGLDNGAVQRRQRALHRAQSQRQRWSRWHHEQARRREGPTVLGDVHRRTEARRRRSPHHAARRQDAHRRDLRSRRSGACG